MMPASHRRERSCEVTPGLAGFIASGPDARAWDEVVAGAIEALAAGFDVLPDRTGRPAAARRRTLLGTFHWRLQRAGLTLEHTSRPRGGELLLSGDAPSTASPGDKTADKAAAASGPDRPVTTQPVIGWQAARP